MKRHLVLFCMVMKSPVVLDRECGQSKVVRYGNRTYDVAAVSIPPVVLGRECGQNKDVRYGNRTNDETNVTRSGFHTAGRA